VPPFESEGPAPFEPVVPEPPIGEPPPPVPLDGPPHAALIASATSAAMQARAGDLLRRIAAASPSCVSPEPSMDGNVHTRVY
jgi:hypothetical protein